MNDLNKRLAGLSPEKRALLMQQLGKQTAPGASKDIGRRLRPVRIPLSFAQQRLWILDQLEPNSAAYNVPTALWMCGTLNVAALTKTLSEIVRRHEILRTVIVTDELGPQQVVLPATQVVIACKDLCHIAVADRRSSAYEAARLEAARPFDLVKGPLLRAVLIKVSEDQHLFVLNAHHIAVDGWSYSVIYAELHKLYRCYNSGQDSDLPELPIQYVDYALWQREFLADDSEALKAQLAYWQERLSGQLPVLELPTDRVRPAIQSYRGAVYFTKVPATLYEALKQLSRQEGVTVFMAFAAAFDTLLMRYSGQTDLIIGVGVANRRRQELESLVGFFVNTLALRSNLAGDPTFRELLIRVKEDTLGAYAHQDLPIERLLVELNLDRSLSHSPLFQVMLFFQNFPTGSIDLDGLSLQPVEPEAINTGTSRADLTLFAGENNQQLTLFFEYATDLFDVDTIEAFAGHLVQLLRSIVADPNQRLSQLEILTEGEKQQLLYEWNPTRAELPAARTIHELFLAQVRRSPDAVAISHLGRQLSYGELNQRSDQLAAQLQSAGVKPGTLVGLFIKRSPEMLVALLAILKTGAGYVPMDPGYPMERLTVMLEDSQAQVVVSERSLQRQLVTAALTVVLVDEPLAVNLVPAPLAEAVQPDDTAYVIFTSGSTGRPKGVQIPHSAVVNFLDAVAKRPGMKAGDTICAVTTLSFDIAVLELLLPLSVGARIELADSATAADGIELARLMETSGTTIMQATPATWRMLLDSGWPGRPGLKMLCGGEALSRELADRLLKCGHELWNMYGPTETTVWSTCAQVLPGHGDISIGTPLTNTEVYIVDQHCQPCPVGVPGELLIGGLGVATGYLARPELTAEKFIADPFGPDADAKLYRTGDLACWHRDGSLHIVGRIDHQVKLRGFRIELGEIESVLCEVAQLEQAVVLCREDRPGDKRLVAYVVTAAGTELDVAALRAHLKTRLPEYMLPSAYVALGSLPHTPNGKIDRRALPAPEATARATKTYMAPRTAEEEVLAQLWADILGREQVSIDDDFFELGGHSLLATKLIARIQKAFGGEILLRTLFEAPTVAGFADILLRERLGSVDADDLAGMLDQLEGLTDTDIEALLAAESVQA